MLRCYMTGYIVLMGAEINTKAERRADAAGR